MSSIAHQILYWQSPISLLLHRKTLSSPISMQPVRPRSRRTSKRILNEVLAISIPVSLFSSQRYNKLGGTNMKYPVIFKTFSVLFSLQSDERWIVPIFGGTIILLLAFSAWRLCTEKKDKWRYRRMMLLSLILWGVGELLWQVNVSQIMIISSILAFASMWLFICQTVVYVVYTGYEALK